MAKYYFEVLRNNFYLCKMKIEAIHQSLLKVLFPEVISTHFEINGIEELEDRFVIRLEELPELLPTELQNQSKIILDGFCNPIELQSFPIKGKSLFLNIYRRRWKVSGEKKHYSNHYNLHPEGVKATEEFANFLKDTFGQTPDQYKHNLDNIMRG